MIESIPNSWAETRLEYAGIWGSGGTPLRSKKDFYGGNINWLKTGDLNNGIVTEVPGKITKLGLAYIGGRLYPPKTVIMAMYGATIGKLGILDIEAAVNQACACCTTHSEIDYKYLFYWLMTYKKEYIALGQGGAQPNISRSVIYEQPFAIPPYPEQQRIIQKIESCFEKIDAIESNLNKIETLLEKYRESLLAKAFRGKLIPQDPNDEPASVFLEKIREERSQNTQGKKERELTPITDDEKPFDLPVGWEWVRLGEILRVSSGKMLSAKNQKGGDIPVYGGNGIAGYHNQSNFEKSVIIIGRVGAKCGVVHITEERSWVTDNALIVDYDNQLLDKLFLAEALSYFNLNQLSNSSAQPVISGEKIYDVPMALPPINEQARIIKFIKNKSEAIQSIFRAIEVKQKRCSTIKESILQKAFEGRLVEQIPSEGNGHDLLAKILSEKETSQVSKSELKTKKIVKKKASAKGKRHGKK